MKLTNTALGVGLVTLYESEIFPFMLSSAFTARTAVKNNNQSEEVKTDVWIAVGLGIAFSMLMAWLLNDIWTGIYGTVFAFVLLMIYEWRGELL